MIPAGFIIEVDTQAAEARTVTIQGTLRASRTGPSRLSLYGNLVVAEHGILDYGTPSERVLVTASIRWFLNEALYVGGHAIAPLPTDVGLWAADHAQVWIHGQYRDTWSSLVETAPAGATTIRVDSAYASGWQVGDLVLLTPTNPRAYTPIRREDERRRIVEVTGQGQFRLDAPLQFAHQVMTADWTDTWGDRWGERMAGKVANLTSNIRFEAADANHHPHIIFMDNARHFVEDLTVVGFSPAPRFVGTVAINGDTFQLPMARYAWHNHQQDDGSRGSYLRRTRLYDGVGDGLHIHESSGIAVEDLVVYNQSRFATRDAQGHLITANAPIMLERDIILRQRLPDGRLDEQGHAADDCWIDRPLVVGWGLLDEPYFNHGIQMWAAVNCAVVGPVATGGFGASNSSGIHWPEGGAGLHHVPHVYRSEAFSNPIGLFSWQNGPGETERIIDILTWNNEIGLGWGAYSTLYWGHQVRSVGNAIQLTHWAATWRLTGFLADGLGRPGTIGIQIGRYTVASPSDTFYDGGVVRGVETNLRHEQTPDGGRLSFVQFVRVAWAAGQRVLFGGMAIPPNGSYIRFRQQTGLPRGSNFTLYRSGDPTAPGGTVTDSEYNALRVDNDTAGTLPRPPRVRLTTPADDVMANGMITLVAESDAASVEFYLANRLLGRAPVVNGRATFTFNMTQHPHRRAYFWAEAEGGGAVNTSRVLRVRKF